MANGKPDKGRGSIPLLIAVAAGVILIVVCSAVSANTEINSYITGAFCALILLAAGAVLAMQTGRADTAAEFEKNPAMKDLMSEAIRSMDFPVVITMVDGRIVWANNSMLALCGREKQSEITGKQLAGICGKPVNEIFSAEKPGGLAVAVGDRSFRALSYILEAGARDYWMTVFDETTEVTEAKAETAAAFPVIAYITLDNLEEVSQFSGGSARSAVAEIEAVLGSWVSGIGGFLREYDRNRYIAVFPKDRLGECTEGGFSVLDGIRRVDTGIENMSVTASIGVSVNGSNPCERERDAASALETAIQRGGDQAVLRTEKGNEYYGGTTKTDQKRSMVRARVIADRLVNLISEAGNVIIMGHKSPDFDCIGGCVGLARLAMKYNGNVKIVTDRKNQNFKICTQELIAQVPEFADIFIDGGRGMDLIRSDTLLIIADVNNLKIVESAGVAGNCPTMVIVDHHRKTADYEDEPEIAYIEPAASSCCELVSEILEISGIGTAAGLTRYEANIMLAGIMLDTKNFTRTSTERTFSAALFLRGAGASPEVARTYFYEDIGGFVTAAKLYSNVRIYRDFIAITVCDVNGTASADDRVAASKSAEALLTVRQVKAAFVMLRTDSSVIISARSDGEINVQLILEKIGGGGHFDSAGAQLTEINPREVMESLKNAIDSYLDSREG